MEFLKYFDLADSNGIVEIKNNFYLVTQDYIIKDSETYKRFSNDKFDYFISKYWLVAENILPINIDDYLDLKKFFLDIE